MKHQRCLCAMVAAIVCCVMWTASNAEAFGRYGWGGVPSPYYHDYGYRYQYNPYIAPMPYYSILPPPFATYQNLYGTDPYSYHSGRNLPYYYRGFDTDYRRVAPSTRVGPVNYFPGQRTTRDPALLDTPASPSREVDLRRARFEITVPTADAVVWYDGVKTTQTGLNRVFVTPALMEDKLYSATIEAQWRDEAGTTVRQKKSFDFVAGETLRHRFSE